MHNLSRLWRYRYFSIFQDGGRPPSWISFPHFWTTDEAYLVVFIGVQNLVGIHAIVSIIWSLNILHLWLEPFTPSVLRILGIWRYISETPERHFCVEKRVTYGSSKSVHLCDLCAWWRGPKRQRNLTVSNWLFAQTTYVVGSKYGLAWWMIFGQ